MCIRAWKSIFGYRHSGLEPESPGYYAKCTNLLFHDLDWETPGQARGDESHWFLQIAMKIDFRVYSCVRDCSETKNGG